MKTGYVVSDVMTKKPITASVKDSLKELASKMKEFNIGSLLIEGKGEEVKGIVTEYDLVRKGLAGGMDGRNSTAEDVMTSLSKMRTAESKIDVFEALKIMKESDIRHLPVMEKGEVIGFATMKDILKIQPELFELIVDKYQLREESRKPVFDAENRGGV